MTLSKYLSHQKRDTVNTLLIRGILQKLTPVADFPGGVPVNAGYTSLIPGLGRSPGKGNGSPSSILAWEISWTEELGGLQSTESQRVGYD